jgi:hypothetical protein
MTNYERIKNQSIEEMATFLSMYSCRSLEVLLDNHDCEDWLLEWLKADESENVGYKNNDK